jgi:hypothetical protein
MTIDEAFKQGIYRLRRDPWAQGEWLELIQFQNGYAPIGKIHSILNREDVPAEIRIPPQDVPLWQVPQDGWEEHRD